MPLALRTLLAVLALAAAVIAQKPKKPPATKKGDAVVEGALGKKLDGLVAGFDAANGGFCGSVLVSKGGKVVLEKGYGLADAAASRPIGRDALWDWASVSKQFTAAALLKLEDEKKVKVDDAIAKLLKNVPKDKAAVTLRQLLNHTSGIEAGFKEGWDFDRNDRASFVRCALGRPMTSSPGEKFDYSNSGYALAAAIVEEVTGDTFEEYCVEKLFRPAGMKDACFIGWKDLDLARVPKIERGKGFTDRPKEYAFAYGNALTWGYRGCGGTVASTADMLAWDRALRGDKLLSKAAKAKLYTVGKDDYALGWKVRDGGKRVEHSGGVLGVITFYVRLLDEDVVVALACSFTPKENLGALTDRLAEAAAK